jgi:Icc-related predicted phosphoesterase
MKILTVSDYIEPMLGDRTALQRLSGVQLILSCGDLPPEYLTHLRSAFNVPLYYVRGNHDIRYRASPPEGCENIHVRLVQFRGLRILGLEGSRWYSGGPHQYTESEMKRTIRRLRPLLWWHRGVDIVLAHSPLRHVRDAEDPCHRGFRSFHWLIRKYAPRYFIHGHIHDSFADPAERVLLLHSTRVINSCGYHLLEIREDDEKMDR